MMYSQLRDNETVNVPGITRDCRMGNDMIGTAASHGISSIGTCSILINHAETIAGGNGRAICDDSGNDTFNLNGGAVTGFARLGGGNHTSSRAVHIDANLAGVPSVNGGTGNDLSRVSQN